MESSLLVDKLYTVHESIQNFLECIDSEKAIDSIQDSMYAKYKDVSKNCTMEERMDIMEDQLEHFRAKVRSMDRLEQKVEELLDRVKQIELALCKDNSN